MFVQSLCQNGVLRRLREQYLTYLSEGIIRDHLKTLDLYHESCVNHDNLESLKCLAMLMLCRNVLEHGVTKQRKSLNIHFRETAPVPSVSWGFASGVNH